MQDPGRIAPDTKLDLAINPATFLARALHMWEPTAAFGHVQNQSAGYLFPMGPFFALGHAVGVPTWIVQRLWIALVLVVATWGVLRVAEALNVGSPCWRLVGALAYALSPAMTSLLGYESGGQLPIALLPWILLPLLSASVEGSTRRGAARSALGVVAMGAVNATSTIAVLPLPALYLLTRRRSERRGSLIRWWVLCVGLASIWWAVPLMLQGRYGLNFVPYTENASTTTATTSAFEVARGTGHWLSYLFVNGAWLRGAWAVISGPLAIVATAALVAGGLYGIARRDMPERTFAAVAVAFGVVAIGVAYAGPAGGPLAGPARSLLDGPLSALRNVSKLEPVLRLPLALGLAHALAQLRVRDAERGLVTALALVVVAAAAGPFVRGEALPAGTFGRIPPYWTSAVHWLDENAHGGRTLLMPAESFGEYRWGRPLDEPLQALARSPWAMRNLVPLGTPELTRVLDGLEQRLDSAAPSPGFADVLARMGIRFVLVRNDLAVTPSSGPPPGQVRRALSQFGGLRVAASFGPLLPSGITTDRLAPDLAAATRPVHALEVYEVRAPAARATTYSLADAKALAGGPESVLQLADRSDPAGDAVTLTPQTAVAPTSTSAADAFRRRDVNFGSVRDNYSYALTAGEAAPGASHDPRDWPAPVKGRSDMQMTGAARVAASSYASYFEPQPERQPWAAFDGDPTTAWITGSLRSAVGQWIEVDVPRAIDPRFVTVQLLRDHPWRPYATAVTLSTDAGHVTRTLRATESPQRLALPPGQTKRVRITIAHVTRGFGSVDVGLREIAIPDVVIDRSAVLPRTQGAAAPSLDLVDRLRADPYNGARADEEGRIDRVVDVAGAAAPISGTVTGRPGAALDSLLATYLPSALDVVASSTWDGLPAFAARNAIDGADNTAWVASPDDRSPSLQLSWVGPRRLDRIEVRRAPGPTLAPTHVVLLSPQGRREVDVGDSSASFDPLVTDQVTVLVSDTSRAPTIRSGQGLVIPAAVGISQLRIPALDDLRPRPVDPATDVHLACGGGPLISVDGQQVSSSVKGQLGDLLALRPLQVTACGTTPNVGAGTHHITTPADGPWAVDSLTLGTAPGSTAMTGRAVRIVDWGSQQRALSIDTGPSTVLATTENFNAGWRARLHGSTLEPIRLDGWRQAWVVPAGAAGQVDLTYTPDRTYRAGLLLGALGVLVVFLLAALRPRSAGLPAARGWSARAGVGVVFGVGTAVLLAGWGAVLIVPVAILCPRRGRPVLAGASYALAGLIAFVQPGRLPGSGSGVFGAPVQVLSVLAVVAVLLALGDEQDFTPQSTPG